MSTPHNIAQRGDFAATVLMPGDPLRAKFIAERFLESAALVNNVRGVQGYTGLYKGNRVSVMASGMGMPSMGIYAYELYHEYGVEKILRIGSAGALHPDLKLFDLVLGQGACTDSRFACQYDLPGTFAPLADFSLLKKAYETAEKKKFPVRVGNLISSDVFYSELDNLKKWRDMGVLAVEMEAAALYMTAARLGRQALALCTISDTPITGGTECTPQEREQAFTQMIEVALEMAKE